MTEPAQRYLDLRSDFGFKHVFANKANKDILIAFLNALLPGKDITHVTLGSTEHKRDSKKWKTIFFDLLCTGINGEQYIIEMQNKQQDHFRDRSVYYMSSLLANQLEPGPLQTFTL